MNEEAEPTEMKQQKNSPQKQHALPETTSTQGDTESSQQCKSLYHANNEPPEMYVPLCVGLGSTRDDKNIVCASIDSTHQHQSQRQQQHNRDTSGQHISTRVPSSGPSAHQMLLWQILTTTAPQTSHGSHEMVCAPTSSVNASAVNMISTSLKTKNQCKDAVPALNTGTERDWLELPEEMLDMKEIAYSPENEDTLRIVQQVVTTRAAVMTKRDRDVDDARSEVNTDHEDPNELRINSQAPAFNQKVLQLLRQIPTYEKRRAKIISLQTKSNKDSAGWSEAIASLLFVTTLLPLPFSHFSYYISNKCPAPDAVHMAYALASLDDDCVSGQQRFQHNFRAHAVRLLALRLVGKRRSNISSNDSSTSKNDDDEISDLHQQEIARCAGNQGSSSDPACGGGGGAYGRCIFTWRALANLLEPLGHPSIPLTASPPAVGCYYNTHPGQHSRFTSSVSLSSYIRDAIVTCLLLRDRPCHTELQDMMQHVFPQPLHPGRAPLPSSSVCQSTTESLAQSKLAAPGGTENGAQCGTLAYEVIGLFRSTNIADAVIARSKGVKSHRIKDSDAGGQGEKSPQEGMRDNAAALTTFVRAAFDPSIVFCGTVEEDDALVQPFFTTVCCTTPVCELLGGLKDPSDRLDAEKRTREEV